MFTQTLNIYSTLIHHHQKLEAAQMSCSPEMNKQTVVHSHIGTLVGSQKEGTIDTGDNTDGT